MTISLFGNFLTRRLVYFSLDITQTNFPLSGCKVGIFFILIILFFFMCIILTRTKSIQFAIGLSFSKGIVTFLMINSSTCIRTYISFVNHCCKRVVLFVEEKCTFTHFLNQPLNIIIFILSNILVSKNNFKGLRRQELIM